MPVLRNPRHERYAQMLAKGKTADEAYADAGYKPNRGNAATLKANQNISRRVEELLNNTAKRVEISKAWVLEQLIKNYDRAMTAEPVVNEEGQFTGTFRYQGGWANKSLELIGKEIGMFIDRKDIRMSRLADMTRDELEVLLAELESDTNKHVH